MRNYTEPQFEVIGTQPYDYCALSTSIVIKEPNEGLDNNHGSIDDTIIEP